MRLWVLFWAILATPAMAQQVGVFTFTGPKAGSVRQQLMTSLCREVSCSRTPVGTKNRVDWQRLSSESVQIVVLGQVATKRRKRVLNVEVLSQEGAVSRKKTFPLGPKGLSPAALATVLELVRSAAPAAPGPSVSSVNSPPAPSADAPEASPPPLPTSLPPREPTPVRMTPAEPAVTEAPGREPTAAAVSKRRVPLLVVELFANLLNRDFRYLGLMTNLRPYSLPFLAMVGGRLEVYPLALSTDTVLAGLGLDVSVALAPWLRSRVEETQVVYPTSTVRFDAGLAWRLLPIRESSFAMIPQVGVRTHSFVVSPGADMTRLSALPNLNYFGVRVGLGLEIGLFQNLIVLFGSFHVIPVLSSGEILSSTFFPRGSNFGLDGNAGVGVTLFKFFQLRAAFQLTRYALSFRSEPTDPAIASGALDQYLGATVGLRFQY